MSQPKHFTRNCLYHVTPMKMDIYYDEFKEQINKINPEKPRWKIVAIFEETAGLQGKGNILTEN